MNKVLDYIVGDFRSTSEAVQIIVNRKLPKWLLVIYYAVMLPVGLILYFPALAYSRFMYYHLMRTIQKEYGR